MIVKKHILVIVFVLLSAASADCKAFRFVDVGDPYPQFCAQQFHADQVCSSSYEKKIAVISFFKLNQSNSQKVLIDLQELHTKHGGKNVSIVGILSGEAESQALDEFLKTNKITFPILLDQNRQVYGAFGVFVYPATGIFGGDKILKYYLPARRMNFKKHVDGYTRFLLKEISESELEKIIHPPVDKTDPKHKKAENYYNFAKVYFKQGKFEKARELLDSAIEAYDKHAPSYSLYGHIYIQEKEYQLGLEKFENALSIDPELEEAKTGKQICLDNL